MIEPLRKGLRSKAVMRAFAPLLSARLHALYDPTIVEALPAQWCELVAGALPPMASATPVVADRSPGDRRHPARTIRR
jgi:hypothetical protein